MQLCNRLVCYIMLVTVKAKTNMARLSISLFGGFSISLDGSPVTSFDSNKVRALLAYLATETDRAHSRDQLAALLWPESPDQTARNNLRYALSNLRKTIGDVNALQPFLCISNRTVKLDLDQDLEVDVLTFSRQLAGSPPALSNLEEAVRLYRGDFLEGFYLVNDAVFEEWAVLKREQFRRQALDALHGLAQAHERNGDLTNALSATWRLVDLEPWSEEAHRYLMLLLGKSGKRTAAISQYETCRRILAKELNIEPSVETTRIYEQIRDGEITSLYPASESAFQPEEKRSDTQAESPLIISDPISPTRDKRVTAWLKIISVILVTMILAGTFTFFPNRSKIPLANAPAGVAAIGEIVGPCPEQSLPRICITNAQTGQITRVIKDLPLDRFGPGFSWSPDGKQIVFVASAKPKQEKREDLDLYVINADGSNLRQITSGDPIDVMPAWSPDGTWIAFHRSCALWTIHPDGTDETPLSSGLCATGIAWSPDSHWIAFLEDDSLLGQRPATIRVFEYGGSDSRIIYTFDQPVSHGQVAWSPDGQQLFILYGTRGSQDDTLLLDAQGQGVIAQGIEIPITWIQDFYPQWGK